MTNVQARLIASALALVAGAVLRLAAPNESGGPAILILAGVLFVVEYVRAQRASGGDPS